VIIGIPPALELLVAIATVFVASKKAVSEEEDLVELVLGAAVVDC